MRRPAPETGGPGRPGSGGPIERPIGIGVHQAVEYLLGLFLVTSSIRIASNAGSGALLGLGVALLLLPAVTIGPLAAMPVLSPTVHQAIDVVLVMLAVTSPLLPIGLDGNAILLMVLTAAALAVLTRSTSYVRRSRRPRRGRARTATPPPAPSARASSNQASSNTASSNTAPSGPARPPAWVRDLGTVAGRARTQLPRQAGRVVGRLKKGRP